MRYETITFWKQWGVQKRKLLRRFYEETVTALRDRGVELNLLSPETHNLRQATGLRGKYCYLFIELNLTSSEPRFSISIQETDATRWNGGGTLGNLHAQCFDRHVTLYELELTRGDVITVTPEETAEKMIRAVSEFEKMHERVVVEPYLRNLCESLETFEDRMRLERIALADRLRTQLFQIPKGI